MLCTSTVIFGRPGPYLEMRRFRFAQTLVVEAGGRELSAWVAESFAQRLLGLAGLPAIPADRGLLIPDCASVHTWGMRFAIDVAFLEWPPGAGSDVIRLWRGGRAAAPGRRARAAAHATRPCSRRRPARCGRSAGRRDPGCYLQGMPAQDVIDVWQVSAPDRERRTRATAGDPRLLRGRRSRELSSSSPAPTASPRWRDTISSSASPGPGATRWSRCRATAPSAWTSSG